MSNEEIETIELELFVHGLNQAYGIDFTQYAKASFKRRVHNYITTHKIPTITTLLSMALHDKEFAENLISSISVTTSEMFRDPAVFNFIRHEVIPYLKTFPSIRVWHAACANGEEVYSLAILLKEEGIYDRCTIYATDFNEVALENARKGIFPLKHIKEYTKNYQRAGGKATLSDYYHAKYDHVIFDKELMKNVTFQHHNLTADSVFIDAQFILCRNAMIYFNSKLQDRVLSLFDESLEVGGVLCLGSKESLKFSSVSEKFKFMDEHFKIYQKQRGLHA